MSQNNPTPTGAWTAKLASHGWYVEFDAMNGACIDNELTAKAIANAHNAALAAERERVLAQWPYEIQQLREQLDAAVEALRRLRMRCSQQIAWYKNPAVNDKDWWLTDFTKQQVEGNLRNCVQQIDAALAKVEKNLTPK